MPCCCTGGYVRQGLLGCTAAVHKACDAQLLHRLFCQTKNAGLYCSIAQGVSSVMPNCCTGGHVRQELLVRTAALHKACEAWCHVAAQVLKSDKNCWIVLHQRTRCVMPSCCTGGSVRQGLLDCSASLHKMCGTRLLHRCLYERHWL